MTIVTATIFTIAASFIWIGFVLSISFMEAWVKFKAPGINLSLGLGIGKLVFGALNKVEWSLALLISIVLLISSKLFTPNNILLFICILCLLVQSFILLPKLNKRADKVIEGSELEKTKLHFYYIGIELLKLGCLFYFGYAQITNNFS